MNLLCIKIVKLNLAIQIHYNSDDLSESLKCNTCGCSHRQYALSLWLSYLCSFFLDAPKVTMPTRTPGYYLQPGQILCSVESLLPFTLSFERNGIALGVDQYLKCVNIHFSKSVEMWFCPLCLTNLFFPVPSWDTALNRINRSLGPWWSSCCGGRRQETDNKYTMTL